MTLDTALINEVDKVAKRLGMTRSGFTRDALQAALEQIREKEKENQHRQGYKRKPVKLGEFSDWEDEQVWIDT
jgi:metal-responsive CopG/Arc/MetJ family transcriptional regulator